MCIRNKCCAEKLIITLPMQIDNLIAADTPAVLSRFQSHLIAHESASATTATSPRLVVGAFTPRFASAFGIPWQRRAAPHGATPV